MAEVINIASFEFDLDKLNKSLDDYQKRLFELRNEQKRYADQNKALESQKRKLAEAQQLLTSSGQQESKAYKEVEAQMKSITAQQEQLFKNQKNLQIETSKVNAEYNRSVKAQQAMRDSMGNLLSSTDAYTQALNREIKTKEDAKKSTSELIKLGDQLDLTNEDNVKTLELINAKIDENTQFLKENSSATQQQRMNIGNYKQDVKDALNEMNLFNGGLAGFATRATEAGGASALLSNSLKAVTSATVGLTKAMLAFLVSPIGIVLGVIAGAFLLIQNAMNRSEESTNKLKAAIAPLTGIFQQLLKWLEPLGEFLIDGIVVGFEMATKAAETAIKIIGGGLKLLGFESAGDAVLDFGNAMVQAGKDAQELASAEAELIKMQRQGKVEMSKNDIELQKQQAIYNDVTKSLEERIKASREIAKINDEQVAIQTKEAEEALRIAKLKIKIYGETADSLNELAEAQIKLNGLEAINSHQLKQMKEESKLLKEERQKQHDAYMKQIEAQITKQKEQLDLWILQQGDRAKTLQEQLDLDRQIAKKSIAILDAELKAKKISQEKYEAEVLKIRMDLAKQEAELMVDNAKRELDILIKNTDAQLAERKRLNGEELLIIKEQENAKLAFEAERYAQGLINETEYQENILSIQDEYLKKSSDLSKQYQEQQKADNDLAAELEKERKLLALEDNAWAEFEAQQIISDEQYIASQEKLQAQYDEGKISYENFLQAKKNLDTEYANAEAEIARLKEQYKLSVASKTFRNLATIAGEESAAGKAFAIAQTTIDTYQAATSAYKAMAGIPVVGPALGAAAAAAAVVAGLKSVKKITSVKTPKIGGGSGGISNPEVQGFADGGVVTGGSPIFRNNGDNTLITARTGEVVLNDVQRSFIGNDILNMAGVPGVNSSNNTAVQNNATGNNSILSEMIAEAVYKGSMLGTLSGAETGMVRASENREIQNNATF